MNSPPLTDRLNDLPTERPTDGHEGQNEVTLPIIVPARGVQRNSKGEGPSPPPPLYAYGPSFLSFFLSI